MVVEISGDSTPPKKRSEYTERQNGQRVDVFVQVISVKLGVFEQNNNNEKN